MNAGCNGWPNTETWRVQLHLTNDDNTARAVVGIAFLYVTRFYRWPISSEQYPPSFAQWLREFVEEGAGVLEVGGTTLEMLSRDLVESALGRVDWDRLADYWLAAGRDDARTRGVPVHDESGASPTTATNSSKV